MSVSGKGRWPLFERRPIVYAGAPIANRFNSDAIRTDARTIMKSGRSQNAAALALQDWFFGAVDAGTTPMPQEQFDPMVIFELD